MVNKFAKEKNMDKQVVIVGLGQYGTSVAKKLSDKGIEVLAIDNDMKTINRISEYVTKAVCMDVMSEEGWNNLPLKDFDIGIVCFGENLSASILSCLALQEAGVKHIIAKAGDRMHELVLRKLNVDEIVSPEEYVASITANSIIEGNELIKN